jgi:hypothetical protein
MLVGTSVGIGKPSGPSPSGRIAFQAVAFAGADDGIVADVVVSAPRRCVIEAYTTVDAGRIWSEPLRIGAGSCNGAPLVALEDSGRFFLATGVDLYSGTLGGRNAKLHPNGAGRAARLVGEPGRWCSLVTGIGSLWATAGSGCDVVLHSGDGGRHWSSPVSFPFARLDHGLFGTSPIAYQAPNHLVAIGWPAGASPSSNPVLADSVADGSSWQLRTLPCLPPRGWFLGLLAASAPTVVVACLSQGANTVRAMEIVVSKDGGRSFGERCGNGLLAISNQLGSCLFSGEPESLGVLSSGRLVLSVGADAALLEESSDGGRVWRAVSKPGDGGDLLLYGGGARLWAYGVVDVPARQQGWVARPWLACSADGVTWRQVRLPGPPLAVK